MAGEAITGLVMLLIMLCVYFLPTILGWQKKNRTAILVLNIFAGWTFIGWIIALVWAVTYEEKKK